MKNSTKTRKIIQGIKSRKIEVSFDGGHITSDAGLLLVRHIDKKLRITSRVAKCIEDKRERKKVTHEIKNMISQLVYGIVAGYEDITDHNELKNDLMFKTAVNVNPEDVLASAPTLCRLENSVDKNDLMQIAKLLVNIFIESYKNPPKELTFDFDATDAKLYGNQENKYFHGYYDDYCFLPLYVFCGHKLLVSYLRPSWKDPAHHCGIIIKLLVKRLRQVWPDVKITIRADSGFCRHKILDWCDNNNVQYVVGIARNNRITEKAQKIIAQAKKEFEQNGTKVRNFDEITYAALTWSRERRVIVKAEHLLKGENTRYLVTNITDITPQELYDNFYTPRGDMENRIKEQQLALFADRMSCHLFSANQFRMFLSSIAYILLEYIRSTVLSGTEFVSKQCATLRLKLIKIGATLLFNTRKIKISLAAAYPYKKTFWQILEHT